MPLPDERPRQSVANLIGRFENQVKRQPSSSPGSVRSLSAASHTTEDSVKEEIREKREWPPKSLTSGDDKRPPPIIPSSSWSRSQASGSPPSLPNLVSSATQADTPEESSLTPRPNSTTSIPDIAKIIPVPKRQLSIGITPPTPSSNTPTTAKPPAKTPVKAPVSKPPPSATPKTPARAAARPSTGHAPIAQPIKAQHTGPASTPPSARKPIPKTIPITPARAKTPSRTTPATSRPKTPTSTRSKTPSTGLFAPTAASLARARNAQPQPPTPTKKTTLSSTSAERLSKPTAASLSRARSPTSVPARGGAKPAVRGGAATRGTPKPRVSSASSTGTQQEKPAVFKAATAAATASAVAGTGLAIAAGETVHPADDVEASPEENGHHTGPSEPADSQDGNHADDVEDLLENEVHMDVSQAEEGLGEGAGDEEVANLVDLSLDATTVEPTDDETGETKGAELASETESHDSSLDASVETEAIPAVEERIDEVKSRSGDDLEAMVNLLESVSISKARPESIASIPDDVAEIPDEE